MITKLPSSVGWIGLGAMGYPMAIQLCKHLPDLQEIHIFDVDPDALDRFVAHRRDFPSQVRVEKNARDVMLASEWIFTIVPEGAHVKDVYLSSDGLLTGDVTGKVFIECSTIDLATSLAIGDTVINSGATFYDAPVSGGTAGAEKGTLTFMVGASQDDPNFSLLNKGLSCMGKSIFPIGGRSMGLAAKLSNNYLSGMIALATAEAMNLGMRLGIDPKVLSQCFDKSSGGSWVNSTVNPVPGVCPDAVTSKNYEGGFKVNMSLAIAAAEEVGAKLVLSDVGLSAYTSASQDPRYRDRDSRVIYRWLGGADPRPEIVDDANDSCA